MSNTAKIIAKIKALRARAADAASSEAEAAKAAAVADKLLREHDIDLSELDVRAEGVGTVVWGKGGRRKTPVAYAVRRIAKATNTEVWVRNGGEIVYLGSPVDCEVALYYTDLVHNAAGACLKAYAKTEAYTTQLRYWSARKISSDFRAGVCQRLGERILEQVEAANAEVTGTGLVVVKDALVRQWLEDRGIEFRTPRGRREVGTETFTAGRNAAENVGIGRGVGTQRSTQGLLA